jgi:hypothetical protein
MKIIIRFSPFQNIYNGNCSQYRIQVDLNQLERVATGKDLDPDVIIQ